MTIEQDAPEMIDSYGVQDIFISGLGTIEEVGGGCLRFTFHSRQHVGGVEVLVVVAKLVAPMEAVGPAALAALKAVGVSIVKGAVKLN